MENIIEVDDLVKRFGAVNAVDGISFQVEKGELYGFLGVNGAGKSTTINMLSTLYAPTEGKIRVCGYDVQNQPDEVRRRIGVVAQSNCLDNKLTVKENLLIRGGLYEKSSRVLKQRLHDVGDVLEMDDLMDRRYEKLSGGQKRRCEVAKALMNRPELLFLDEPTTGLDPATRKGVWSSLKKLRSDLNMTIFLTTHYMEEAARASHISILDKGKMLEYGTPFTLKEKYAKDKIFLVPKNVSEMEQYLTKKGMICKVKGEKISLVIGETKQAIPLLNEIQDMITGFEVIQGSMDDVFLNVTNQGLEVLNEEADKA